MGAPHLYTPAELAERPELVAVLVEARGVDVPAGVDAATAVLAHQDATGINPALEAVPAPAVGVVKRYRVIAPSAVLEQPPGSEWDAAISPELEAFLTTAGAIEVVSAVAPIADASPPAAADASPPAAADASPPAAADASSGAAASSDASPLEQAEPEPAAPVPASADTNPEN